MFDNISHTDLPSDDQSNVVKDEKGKKSHQCPCCSYTSKVLCNLKRHVRMKHTDDIDPDFSLGKRKRKALKDEIGTPEKKKKLGRPKKSEKKPKSGVKERIFTGKDEELFSFATKLSDGETVDNYEALGGIEATAKHLVTKGGRLSGVPANGPFVGLRRRREGKKSPFFALAALRKVPGSDSVFEAVVLASSYPGSVQLNCPLRISNSQYASRCCE